MPPATTSTHATRTTTSSQLDLGEQQTAARQTPDRARDGTAPSDTVVADFCVIGGGSGGLAVAMGAAAVGQRVVLIEKHKLGGDGMHYGAVPSKALVAAARRAHAMRTAQPFGIEPVEPAIDPSAVRDHVYGVVAAVALNGAAERYTAMGVRVVQAAARFIDKTTVAAGDLKIKARRFVIATGSSPAVPAIPGIETAPYFTNDTIFDVTRRMDHLVILGANARALELAQSFRRLGSSVTVLDDGPALPGEDGELAEIALQALRAEGVDIREHALVEKIMPHAFGIRLAVTWNGASGVLEGSHLFVSAGRRANTAELNLDAAGIKAGPRGIIVDKALRTSNRRVYAIGDAAGGTAQSHMADYQAGIVLKRALFRLRATADATRVPRVTFLDPEIAWVGLSEDEGRSRHKRVHVLRWPYAENDRAQAERTTTGHVKVVTDPKGIVIGAGIVGAQAGELIQVWALAIAQGLDIKAMTDVVAPYPTLSDINRRVALRTFAASAGRPAVRWAVRFLGRFG